MLRPTKYEQEDCKNLKIKRSICLQSCMWYLSGVFARMCPRVINRTVLLDARRDSRHPRDPSILFKCVVILNEKLLSTSFNKTAMAIARDRTDRFLESRRGILLSAPKTVKQRDFSFSSFNNFYLRKCLFNINEIHIRYCSTFHLYILFF